MIFKNLEAILAIDNNFGLSKEGGLPWKSKKDMLFFKNKTINNYVIMGSKTLLSLPKSQPLKNRINIILTTNKEKYSNMYKKYEIPIFFYNFEETLKIINENKNDNFFIIGGKEIYNLFFPYCSCVWLTKFKNNYNCDLFIEYELNNLSIINKELIYNDNELDIFKINLQI